MAGHDESYYSIRQTILDFRGNLKISPLSYWGFFNRVITSSHSIDGGEFVGRMIDKTVIVDDYAWITSFAILYNCHIKHHGIVSIGSVVHSMTVEPYTIVEGNPAKVVARWDGKTWVRTK